MHLHRESTQVKILGGVKVLLILLISYTSCVSSNLTQEEITQLMNDLAPERFCGRKLTEAMRSYCSPGMKNLIMQQLPVKKSCKMFSTCMRLRNLLLICFSVDSNPEFDFETFDLDRMASEIYDDEVLRTNSRYKTDESYANDIPYFFPSQGHRRRRGIIDECCKKPCRKQDLITFCPKKQY